jgi:hypothetical protein
VAKWRTRPPHATQALGEYGVATEKRVRHPDPRVANSPPDCPPRPPAPPLRWSREMLGRVMVRPVGGDLWPGPPR